MLKDCDLRRRYLTASFSLPMWPFIAIAVLFKLWLVEAQHLTAIGNALYDDRLFVDIATSLTAGNWLGTYNCAILAKGPVYPIWIAMVSFTGIPLLLAQHLFYIAACSLAVFAVGPLVNGRAGRATLFMVLLFNPMSFEHGLMTQVIREGIYPALTLFVFACASGLLLKFRTNAFASAVWSMGLGLSLSALWLTREEGPWIVPAVLLILVAALVSALSKRPRMWRRTFLLVLPALVLPLSLLTVASLNRSRYGIFTVNEMTSGTFRKAYGALLRVKHKDWKPVVPVPEDVRKQLYAVSPAFAELKPYLEGETGKRWKEFDNLRKAALRDPDIAASVKKYLDRDASGIWRKAFYDDTGTIPGGWFVWALREAVARAGYYKSGETSSRYYRRLALEVNTACKEGRLQCGPERSSLMPPWHSEYDVPFLKTLASGAVQLASFDGFDANPDYSYGDPASLKLFRDITHEKLAPSEFEVKGWAFSPQGPITVSIRTRSGEKVGGVVGYLASPDVYKKFLGLGSDFPAARESRFDVRGPIIGKFAVCKSGCYMVVEKEGRTIGKIPLDGPVKSIHRAGLYMHLDFAGFRDQISKGDEVKLKVLGLVGKLYHLAAPWLMIVALAIYIFSTCSSVIRRVSPGPAWVVVTFVLVAVLSRLVILSLIHVTSFPAIIPQYLAPAYPLILIFIMVIFMDSFPKMSGRSKRKR